MTPTIEAKHLWFSYEEGHPILKDVSVRLEKGKKLALMGPNGAGKSTFFLCLNGILHPQKGQLYYKDTPYDYHKKGLLHLRKQVGIVFQDPDNQLFLADISQEIAFGLLNLGVSQEKAREKIKEITTSMGISAFMDRPIHALSGGQKKQVSIADILVMEPELVILDEPFASLDQKHAKLVEKMIDTMTSQGITVLMATHDSNYAYKWADEVIGMSDGKIVFQGNCVDFFTDQVLLQSLSLTPPDVLTLYMALKEKGLIEIPDTLPRTTEELLTLIQHSKEV